MELNNIIIAGNIVRDPELKYLGDGSAICNFTLANNRGRGEKKTVCFIDCTAFKKTAENINEYLSKGSGVTIEGVLNLQQWEKDGVKHRRHNILVSRAHFWPKDASPRSESEPPPPSQPKNSGQSDEDDLPF